MKSRALVQYLCIIACCALLLPSDVGATTQVTTAAITVNSTLDLLANDGFCTLREAILSANSDSAIGGCTAGSGADTILFDAALSLPATFQLTKTGANEDGAQSGDLDISGTVTITPANSSQIGAITIDGNESDRIFHVLTQANLTVNGVIIQHGNPGNNSDGGGVLVDSGARLTMNNSIIRNNSAAHGAGGMVKGRFTFTNGTIEENAGSGVTNDGGLLTLANVTVANHASSYGIINQNIGGLTFTKGIIENNQGGIYNSTSTATLSDLSIHDNHGNGGVQSYGSILTKVTISKSQIYSNSADSGAGLLSSGSGSVTTIIDTQILSNSATGSGGGIFNNGTMTISGLTLAYNQAAAGGGLRHFGGNLTLTNVTISSNSVSNNGGGFYGDSTATLTHVTMNNNQAGGADSGDNFFNDEAQISIRNTIIAGSSANCFYSGGFVNSLGNNLDSSDSCSFHSAGDLINSNAQLGPLQNNGGATWTHALLSGSSAIDAAKANYCIATDQRGIKRPQGALCDIGAYEAEGVSNNTPTPTPTSTSTSTSTSSTATATPSPSATSSSTVTSTTIAVTATNTPQSSTGTPIQTPTNTPATQVATPATATATSTPIPSETHTATPTSVATSPELLDFRSFLPIVMSGGS